MVYTEKDKNTKYRCKITNDGRTIFSEEIALSAVQTGDTSNMMLWYAVMLLGIAGVVIAGIRRKKITD